jgi:hypothetical protein
MSDTQTRTLAQVQQELTAALETLKERKRETSRARSAEVSEENRVNGLRRELTQLVAPHLDFDTLAQTAPAIQHRRQGRQLA